MISVPDIIPISHNDYDRLYPKYEKALREHRIEPDATFQEWLRQHQGLLTWGSGMSSALTR